MYNPSPFTTPLILLIPTVDKSYGVTTKEYPTIENGERINGSFKTYGGTERTVNGVYAVEDTATVETWFRPDIDSSCRIAIAGTDKVYEIIGEPENIEMRNQFCVFKVRRYKGGA